MKRLPYAFIAVAALTGVYVAIPRKTDARIIYGFRFAPGKGEAYYKAAETSLDAWLRSQGFSRVAAETYEAKGTPPFRVDLQRPFGELGALFDWAYDGWGWFETDDHRRARSFAAALKAWRDAYFLNSPSSALPPRE